MSRQVSLRAVVFALVIVILSAACSWAAAWHATRSAQRQFTVALVSAVKDDDFGPLYKTMGLTPRDFGINMADW